MKKAAVKKAAPQRRLSSFRPRVRSRHGTHDSIRGKLGFYPKRCVIRLGSTTPTGRIFPDVPASSIIEINPVEGVKNSANKRLMKTAFTKAGVKTAPWFVYQNNHWVKVIGVLDNGQIIVQNAAPEFPVVSKHVYGSRGTGNAYHEDQAHLDRWTRGKSTQELENYIVEEYFTGVREYRLHTSKNGCFYTNRKMLKNDTPEAERWYRNDDNSVWIMDTNPAYDRPRNFAQIEADCVKALHAMNLDVAAFDVRVQSARDKKGKVRENPDYIILESNSAPSFGTVTVQKYLAALPSLIKAKL